MTEPWAPASETATLIRCANDLRAHYGQTRLTVTERLSWVAARHARAMRDQDFFGHDNPITGSDPASRVREEVRAFTYVGENIAAGQADAREACRDLRASPGHRRNMLRPHFTNIGAGVAKGGRWRTYYVQLFAARGL